MISYIYSNYHEILFEIFTQDIKDLECRMLVICNRFLHFVPKHFLASCSKESHKFIIRLTSAFKINHFATKIAKFSPQRFFMKTLFSQSDNYWEHGTTVCGLLKGRAYLWLAQPPPPPLIHPPSYK